MEIDAHPQPASAASLTELRAAGVHRFDPLAMGFIEALAGRIETAQGRLRPLLEARLQKAIAQLKQDHQKARAEILQALPEALKRYPHALRTLQQLADAGELKSLQSEILKLQILHSGPSLAELTRSLEDELAKSATAEAPRVELKAVRDARATWAALSVERELAQALKGGPQNAGPINSHMLMLRSLEMMQEISPHYLHRFVAWADTLLRLDSGQPEKQDKPEKAKKPRTRKPRTSPAQD